MASGHDFRILLIALNEAFAIFCGCAPETPIEDIIGQPAVDLIVKRARKWLVASVVSLVLWIVAGISATRFLVGLLPSADPMDSPYNLVVSVACALIARFLLKTRHEASKDQLLATAKCDEHRRGILKLEEFLDLVGTEAMPAAEDVPERPVDLGKLPQISNALFRSDNGRLLLVRPDLFWLVRNKLTKPVAPILVWFDESKFAPVAPTDQSTEIHSDIATTRAVAPWETEETELSWLYPIFPSEVEEWHGDYWPNRPHVGRQDDSARDLLVYSCANRRLREEFPFSLTSLAERVLTMAQEGGSPIGLSTETVSRMLGWSQSEQHKKYTGFRDYAINRLKSEDRWPPRKHDDQLQLFRNTDQSILSRGDGGKDALGKE